MTKKLFVGGLSWGTKDEQLKAAFEKYGTVAEAKVILDMDTGRSRGFGFVEMDEADATKAISDLDGRDFDGRNLRVNEAQERSRTSRDPVGGRPPGGGGGYRGSSGGGGAGGAHTSRRRSQGNGGIYGNIHGSQLPDATMQNYANHANCAKPCKTNGILDVSEARA